MVFVITAVIIITALAFGILSAVVHKTPSEKKEEDQEQEEFLREYKKRNMKVGERK